MVFICAVAQNSGGIARRSPAPSPTMRRKNYQDEVDHVRGNRTQEKKNSYNDQYKAGQRQQQQHRENYGMSGRGGSGSDSSRTGSGYVFLLNCIGDFYQKGMLGWMRAGPRMKAVHQVPIWQTWDDTPREKN